MHSYVFLATQPPPKPTCVLPSPAILPLIEALVTHPAGGTMASNFIPMHLPETCALRYGIQSLSHKRVDQPKYTSGDGNKGTRLSLRLDPPLSGSRKGGRMTGWCKGHVGGLKTHTCALLRTAALTLPFPVFASPFH